MKKLLTLAAVTCFATFSAQAQLVGIEGGISSSRLRTDWEGVDVDHEARLGLRLGGFVDIPIARGASFQPGIYYAPKGGTLEVMTDNIVGGTVFRTRAEQKVRINYLEIPMNFQFKMNPMRRSGFFFGAGPYVAFATGGELEFEQTTRNMSTGATFTDFDDNRDLEIGDDEDEDDVKGTDWGINVNLGYVGMGGLFIRGNAGVGLSNIDPLEDDDFQTKNLSFALTLGYVFGR